MEGKEEIHVNINIDFKLSIKNTATNVYSRQLNFVMDWGGGGVKLVRGVFNQHSRYRLSRRKVYITKTTKDLFVTRNICDDEAITYLVKNFSHSNKSWFAKITFLGG